MEMKPKVLRKAASATIFFYFLETPETKNLRALTLYVLCTQYLMR